MPKPKDPSGLSEMTITWSTKLVSVEKLKDHDKNPRRITKKQFNDLVRSVKEDGYHQRIIANADLTIIGGHQRKKAMLEAGFKLEDQVEVLVPNRLLSEEEFKRINIRDNLPFGEFDFDILANNFERNNLIDWGMPDDWIPEIDQIEYDEDEQEISLNADPVVKTGDIWQLGKHRLMCGDSINIDDVDRLINGNRIDLAYNDPPYGISLISGEKNKIGKSQYYKKVIGDDSIETAVESYHICLAKGIKNLIFWGANYYASALSNSKCWIVWNKRKDGKHIDFADCELAWTNFNSPARSISHKWDGLDKDSERGEKRIHPTQKPVQLAIEILRLFEVGKHVLDLFGGSGSTLIACEKSNRVCFMMEMDPYYCDLIIRRWESATNKRAELTNG